MGTVKFTDETTTVLLEEVGTAGRACKADRLRLVHIEDGEVTEFILPLSLLPLGILDEHTILRLLRQK